MFGMTPDIGQGVSDIGQGIGDFMEIGADQASAQAYSKASTLAQQSANIEQASTTIQLAQQQRQEFQANSQTKADVAGNGLAQKGSAGDILRSSAQQGALARGLIGAQGQINENAYTAEAATYGAESKQAATKAQVDAVSGATSVAGGILSFL